MKTLWTSKDDQKKILKECDKFHVFSSITYFHKFKQPSKIFEHILKLFVSTLSEKGQQNKVGSSETQSYETPQRRIEILST